jgi:hypothetical protein
MNFANRTGVADLEPRAARLASDSEWFHERILNDTTAPPLELWLRSSSRV